MGYSIGIDIGGGSTKIGVVDGLGNIKARSSLDSARISDTGRYISELTGALRNIAAEAGGLDRIESIGIGAPNGNRFKGTIEYAHNVSWCHGVVPLAGLLEDELNVRTILTNDANAAAMGEMRYGAARSMRNFILLTLGTGLGSGIVIDGRIVYGADGFAGELGHTKVVRPGGRPCGCGMNGCLEAYCSATGVAHTARELIEQGKADTLLNAVSPSEIKAGHVCEAAVRGDRISIEILERTGTMLGEAAANFAVFSSPEAIILFGGLCGAGDYLRSPMIKAMNENLIPRLQGRISVLFSELPGADAAILGAASLAME